MGTLIVWSLFQSFAPLVDGKKDVEKTSLLYVLGPGFWGLRNAFFEFYVTSIYYGGLGPALGVMFLDFFLRLCCFAKWSTHIWHGALDHQNPALRGRATYELSSQMLVFSIFLEFVIATYVKWLSLCTFYLTLVINLYMVRGYIWSVLSAFLLCSCCAVLFS